MSGVLFSQFASIETIELPEKMPDIGQVISIIADPEVVCLKMVNTMKGISEEGQCLSGKMVTVYIRLKQKILYAAETPAQTIHSIENEIFQSVCIVVPPLIEGTDIDVLIKYKYLKAKISMEDTIVKKIDSRSIFKNINFLIQLYLVPTYELCYSMVDDAGGVMYVCHEDGGCSTQLISDDDNEIVHPEWSPSGQEVACLFGRKSSYALYIVNPKDCEIKKITNPSVFSSVNSYSWSMDGWSIIFSSRYKGGRELFYMDLHNFKWRQLTYGSAEIKSFSPKCSPDGSRIAFLKSVSNIPYLYIMDMDGLNCKKASESTGVKDFDWSSDSRFITYIRSKGGRPDELCIFDTADSNEEVLVRGEYTIQKRNVQFSPDRCSVAFIGSDLCTEDVYVYDIKKHAVNNITDNFKHGQVRDYAWKIDSSKIYYVSDELSNLNVFCISLNDYGKSQLTNTSAIDMNLCYRPKIR